MTRQLSAQPGSHPRHVSLLAVPDAVVSTLFGIFDVMNAFTLMELSAAGTVAPFQTEIVGEGLAPLELASGVPISVQRSIDSIETTDIVIVPSVVLRREGWHKGRYPRLVEWLRAMYQRGAVLCSACSGIFLLAETGLFDGKDATVHFGYAKAFARTYPAIPIHPERVLVIAGSRDELVSSGASTTWHIPFQGKSDHGDGEIQSAQEWLSKHFSIANPVDEMIKRSKLAERTFKRRFTSATGLAPIAYVQRLRIEDAKRRLERTEASVDEVSWRVGYEDSAFFRRLFKRTTGLAPGAYRRRFRIPEFARSPGAGRRR
jgi:transcriptional regulator GlxA family with amidase domain